MSIETAIRSYLLTQSALTTTASTRISVQTRDQGQSLPAVVIHLIDEQHGHYLTAANTWGMARLQIDSLATTYPNAESIDVLVRNELEGMGGTTIGTSSTYVTSVIHDDRRMLPYANPKDASDVGIYGISSDYFVQFALAVSAIST